MANYGTIENLYKNLETADLTKGVRTKLENGKSSAEESKWLVTINREVPIDTEISNYKIGEIKKDELSRFLTELEMFKIMDKLGLSVADGISTDAEKMEIKEFNIEEITIDDSNIETVCSLKSCCYLFNNNILQIINANKIYVTNEKKYILKFFSSECKKSTSGAKEHYHFAFENNSELKNLEYDAEICGYLLNASSTDYSIEKLCGEYNVHYYTENEKYSDLISLSELMGKLLEAIENDGLMPLLKEIEMPLTEVLASMEHYGVKTDIQGVKDFGIHLSEMIEETSQAIYDDAGHTFNISSPKQLAVVLFEELGLPAKKKTKSGYSTNADVLEELRTAHPIVENVLKYRQYTKLNSTYVDGLLKTIASDGRIHTCFKQTETRTGRISSTEPNMQNIPVRTELGSRMRKFFIADDNKVLLDADYSQIELRVMAHLCGDENMISAFTNNEDIHTSTAAQVFDMPKEMVTPEMRSAAKAVNFGIIYGIGAFSLSKDINVSVYKAKKYIEDYLSKYPKVKQFMDNTVKSAEETGFVSTMFGRKRRIPELSSSNKVLQAAGRRIAMNTPVQGTAADLIKIAMINVYNRLKKENLDAHLILQVHDELIVESSDADCEKAKQILQEEMQNVCKMRVPLSVDVNEGASWYDAKG